MLDYTEKSVVRVYSFNDGGKESKKFTGMLEIRGLFTGLFQKIHDLSTLEAPVVDVDEEGK